jgi:hypothetical protein
MQLKAQLGEGQNTQWAKRKEITNQLKCFHGHCIQLQYLDQYTPKKLEGAAAKNFYHS